MNDWNDYLAQMETVQGVELDDARRVNDLACVYDALPGHCTFGGAGAWAVIRKNPAILLSQGFRIWRKRRDSNSRTLSGRRFSRPVPSTARPRFQSEAHYKHLFALCKARN
jgi:hypothetical protein